MFPLTSKKKPSSGPQKTQKTPVFFLAKSLLRLQKHPKNVLSSAKNTFLPFRAKLTTGGGEGGANRKFSTNWPSNFFTAKRLTPPFHTILLTRTFFKQFFPSFAHSFCPTFRIFYTFLPILYFSTNSHPLLFPILLNYPPLNSISLANKKFCAFLTKKPRFGPFSQKNPSCLQKTPVFE